jgi:hypothetical protein
MPDSIISARAPPSPPDPPPAHSGMDRRSLSDTLFTSPRRGEPLPVRFPRYLTQLRARRVAIKKSNDKTSVERRGWIPSITASLAKGGRRGQRPSRLSREPALGIWSKARCWLKTAAPTALKDKHLSIMSEEVPHAVVRLIEDTPPRIRTLPGTLVLPPKSAALTCTLVTLPRRRV